MDGIERSIKSKTQIKIYESITQINQKEFDSIQDPNNPLLEFHFLLALENSDCIGRRSGWDPRYICLLDNSKIIGALIFFIKTDSYGEYIFDWDWARAYYDSGIPYYPKAVVGIPFTPTNSEKIVVDSNYDYDECASLLIESLIEFCKDKMLSSIHFLFISEKEKTFLKRYKFLERITHQYHWHNRNYKTFDDFLNDLRSNKRKQIKKERKHLLENGVTTKIFIGNEITKYHIDQIWEFYVNTNSRKWGQTYLNKRFFDILFEKFRERTVIVLAKQGGCWIGGTINFFKNSKLYGRYWGCSDNVKFLHFECSYYKLIDFSIQKGIKIFEAGAQGEHKFLRGFVAVPIYSSHLLFHKGASDVIGNFLKQEKAYTQKLINRYNNQSPLKYLYRNNE